MKILITGGNGYIAKSLYSKLSKKYDVNVITRTDLDLSNSEQTIKWFKNKIFDVIIHCASEGGSRLKTDTFQNMDTNLLMYYNLLQCRSSYKKFIYFGSGAELYDRENPYGSSKYVMSQSIKDKENFFNLRIFGVFDENELDTRFIKSNIKRYINKQSIEVYEDKYMDFIYMPDLIRIVDEYINKDNLPKQIDCVYNKTCSLTRIAQIINNLSDYTVDIKINKVNGKNYIGSGIQILIDFIGLEDGIKQVFEKLKNHE